MNDSSQGDLFAPPDPIATAPAVRVRGAPSNSGRLSVFLLTQRPLAIWREF